MAVSNELKRPDNEGDFEAMCLQLYSRVWNVNVLMRVGRAGQAQFGVDILGHDGRQSVGIQCKHYISTKFTFATVASDVVQAEVANLAIQHLLFATTAPASAEVVKAVHELSECRRVAGKFTISVDYWNAICDHIRMHPEVGRAFIPGFPGGTLLTTAENVAETLTLVQDLSGKQEVIKQEILDAINAVSVGKPAVAPDARGDEADPGVVVALDHIRDEMRAGKTADAKRLLERLGDPSTFKDEFSKFRWTTNTAAIAMLEGDDELAAAGFIKAFDYARDDERAHINRVQSYFLRKKFETADVACEEALAKFPENAALWGLRLHTRDAVGHELPDSEIPAAVLDAPDFLFARSRFIGNKGDTKGAIDLLRRCIAKDGGSLDARRAMLSESLTWAASDPVAALFGQLPDERRAALATAVALFEPLEQQLPAQQADKISEELATNIVSSLIVLGHAARAKQLAQQLLSRHPLLEQLLRTHVQDLAERGDFGSLRTFTDDRLEEMPGAVLALLAEASAHEGDVAWNRHVMAFVEHRAAVDEKLRRALPLVFLAAWRHGDKQQALAGIQTYLQAHPGDFLAGALLGRFLQGLGKRREAINVAIGCMNRLPAEGMDLETMYVADLLFNLKLHREAALLYRRLVRVPSGDEMTRKLLVCWVQTDQRRLALDMFGSLPPQARAQTNFRRIEINLAGRMGDWSRIRMLLEQELAEHPTSPEAIVGCADVLFRVGDIDALKAFVAQDPDLKAATPEQEIAFARLQTHCGLDEQAIRRLFRLFRAHPTSEKLAGHFLARLIMSPGLKLTQPVKVIAPGVAIHLKQGDESWTVAIDDLDAPKVETWPDLVRPDSDVAQRLMGLATGQSAVLRRGMFDAQAEVVGISTLIAFAAEKAQALIASSANSAGPIWSVRIVKDDGEINIDLLLRTARERRERIEGIFRAYSQHPLPLCVLAQLIGTDPIQLLMEWPSIQAPLFVGIGNEGERNDALAIYRSGRQRYVIDLLTIAELVRLDVAEPLSALIGRPLVAQTQRERLLAILAGLGDPRDSLNLSEKDGRLQLVDIPPSYFIRRSQVLESVLAFIDNHCELVPTVGPEILTEVHQKLALNLDHSTLDTLYLCLEHDAVLLSEDGGLRMLSAEAGVKVAVGLQPAFMVAMDRRLLSHEKYVDMLTIKLRCNQSFISVGPKELLAMALKTPDRVAPATAVVLQSFRKSTLELSSGLKVSVEFLQMAAMSLSAITVGRYAKAILESLKHDRPKYAKALIWHLGRAVRPFYGRNGRRLQSHVRREFGRDLLKRR